MDELDIVALLVLSVLAVAALVALLVLGALPGKIAARRGHPQADAVRVCGWLGVLTMGLLWPLAVVWAYYRPGQAVAPAAAEAGPGKTERSPEVMASLARLE